MYLNNPINRDMVLQEQLTRNTQIREVQLTWIQRAQKNTVVPTAVRSCDAGEKQGTICDSYKIDKDAGSSKSFTIDPGIWTESCAPIGQWAGALIQDQMNAITGEMNERVITAIGANFGDFAEGSTEAGTPGPFATNTSTADIETSLGLIQDVTFESENNGYCGIPFVFGYGELYKYLKRVAAGCCADPLGVDLGQYAQQNGMVFIKDKTVEKQLGENNFFVLDQGSAQLVYWNEFIGAYREFNTGAETQGILIDPISRLPFDFWQKVECGVWNMQLKLAWDVIFMPANTFQSGDEYEGVNGINHFVISN